MVTTQEVSEQAVQQMEGAAGPRGIGVVVVDWRHTGLPRLAALCAEYPDSVVAVYGEGIRDILDEIRSSPKCAEVLDSIKSELRSSTIGFEALRESSHRRVRDVWVNRSRAEARFNQNVAGGANGASQVVRKQPTADLNDWFEADEIDHPGLVLGREGVGKTWATLDWLQSNLNQLPIVVLVPSSSVTAHLMTPSDVIGLIARALRDLEHDVYRDLEYWENRVRRLLRRPAEDNPAFLIFFDGLNERPSFEWITILNQLQDEPFYRRTVVLASVRESFLLGRLGGLQSMGWEPTRIEVGPFDMAPGGEFDQRLNLAGLSRDELPDSLTDLARVPRMFDLVVQLKDRLGGVEAVTIHRVLWEYGASAISPKVYGPMEWREFILELAKEFRDGTKTPTRKRVAEIAASTETPEDTVYARVSSMVDGVFAKLSEFGELVFEPEFVAYSLGLALVKALATKAPECVKEELDRFLQPINDYDQKAEIVRAAVSIVLAVRSERGDIPGVISALCCSWVQSQNLPEGHVVEIGHLAPELVEPLLDAIESSAGHASSSPRYVAVNALSNVDKFDRGVARVIAARGAQWFRMISQDRRGPSEDDSEHSSYQQRRERLLLRLGSAEKGLLIVLGQQLEILEQVDEELGVVAAQLLQGRPLAEAIECFVAEALQSAITGSGRDEFRWLNVLNMNDPMETARFLREISEEMAARAPEPGVHVDLNRRVAAILLWRTGYIEDAKRAQTLNPGIDDWYSYKENYLPDPAASFFPLERRHALDTLSRGDVALLTRIRRVSVHLLDPSFTIPPRFMEAVVAATEALDFEKMVPGRSRSQEDLAWQDLSGALARCAPRELARIERARLRSYATRSGDPRYGAALAAPDSMLLVDKEERAALQALRTPVPDEMKNVEWTTQTYLLRAEIQTEAPAAQIRRIVDSGLDAIGTSLAKACSSPSSQELDSLIEEYRSDVRKLMSVTKIVAEKNVTLSDKAFDIYSSLLDGEPPEGNTEPIWVLLGLNSPKRLGAALDNKRWTWSADNPPIENKMGSRALAAAKRNEHFSEVAFRLAPTMLLHALSTRRCSQEDVRTAVALLNGVILDAQPALPTTHLDVTHDRESAEKQVGYQFSIGDIREENHKTDQWVPTVQRMRSPEGYEKRRRTMGSRYFDEVMKAKRSGAHFFLEVDDPEHFDVVFDFCPEAIDRWLDGMDARTSAFTRRVQLANGFFSSLCEAMLIFEPSRGVRLWHALRECLGQVRFTVHGDMDKLVHALFASAPCKEVDKALEEIYDIRQTGNDQELVNLIVAARVGGRLDWLRDAVALDAASPYPINQRRAALLEAMLTIPDIASEHEWPQGETTNFIRETAWKLAQREACARHWLIAFSKAETVEDAHAAWRLFLGCADRRAWSWIHDVLENHSGRDANCEAAKKRFLSQQHRRLQRAMSDNEKQWKDNFTAERYPKFLLPWNREE